MADLTANAYLRFLGEIYQELWNLDSSVANHPYRGSPMIIDQSADTVNLTAYVDAVVVAATDVFIGIAAEELNVASGAVEANSRIQVIVGPTIVGFQSAVFTNADLGATVYMSDSGVLSTTAADNPQIGKLHRVEDGYAYVELVTPQVCAGA
ncbi:MAG: hypothetical protein IT318_23715 [Anaerolineales bacterium]|nr:hypothetical protein [Anaerolineales bacterium]